MSLQDTKRLRNSTIDGMFHMQRTGDGGSFGMNEAHNDLKNYNKKLGIIKCPNCQIQDPLCFHKSDMD